MQWYIWCKNEAALIDAQDRATYCSKYVGVWHSVERREISEPTLSGSGVTEQGDV